MGPQTGRLLDTVSRSLQRVWGHPNKHFRKAKMASVLTLALLAANALPRKQLKLNLLCNAPL